MTEFSEEEQRKISTWAKEWVLSGAQWTNEEPISSYTFTTYVGIVLGSENLHLVKSGGGWVLHGPHVIKRYTSLERALAEMNKCMLAALEKHEHRSV